MFLTPWIGKDYFVGINGKKLLIFGESHYDKEEFGHEDCECDFTIKILNNVVKERERIRFFEFVGSLIGSDSFEVWNKVAFANLIQFVLKEQSQPKEEHIETIVAFYKYLEMLKPDKAIVCSSRAWLTWFPKYIDNEDGIELDESFRIGKSYIFKYPHSRGKTQVIGINHSSSREPDYIGTWKPIVQSFLEK